MTQDEYNEITEDTASLSIITYERLEGLIAWLQKFIHSYNEQTQFILETAMLSNVNPELKKRVYLNKRMDELDEMFKNFLAYYNTQPHRPTLK
jgi:mannose/fructose/N-acetylgalactosamine-specific phosphotransferase system component IID